RAQEAFRQAGRWFGQGLSALVNLVNPPLVVIGGPEEVVGPLPKRGQGFRRQAKTTPRRSAQLFREGYNETLHAYSFAELHGYCEIKIGSLSVEKAAVGVALLAMRAPEPAKPESQPGEAARRRGAFLDRHRQGGGRRARARARGGAGERRDRAPRRPRARRGGRRRRRLPLPHAHAGRAEDDAGRPSLRRRGRRGGGVPRG